VDQTACPQKRKIKSRKFYGSYAIFGVSMALGAFFAGMVVKESDFSHRAED
jgi:predicted Kef-type K+ transport protein